MLPHDVGVLLDVGIRCDPFAAILQLDVLRESQQADAYVAFRDSSGETSEVVAGLMHRDETGDACSVKGKDCKKLQCSSLPSPNNLAHLSGKLGELRTLKSRHAAPVRCSA